MTEHSAVITLQCVGSYVVAGLAFALIFLAVGIGRIDPAAKHAPFSFKLVVLPGIIVWWPLLAWRWLRGTRQPPDERSPHLRATRRRS